MSWEEAYKREDAEGNDQEVTFSPARGSKSAAPKSSFSQPSSSGFKSEFAQLKAKRTSKEFIAQKQKEEEEEAARQQAMAEHMASINWEQEAEAAYWREQEALRLEEEDRVQRDLEYKRLCEETERTRLELLRIEQEQAEFEKQAKDAKKKQRSETLAAKQREKEEAETAKRLEEEKKQKEAKEIIDKERLKKIKEKREQEAAEAADRKKTQWSLSKFSLNRPSVVSQTSQDQEDDYDQYSDRSPGGGPQNPLNLRFRLAAEWSDGYPLLRPGRSLLRLRKFRHLVRGPAHPEDLRDCVLAVFTDIIALCKRENSGVLRVLFKPLPRHLVYAEVADFDPNLILFRFGTLPDIYLQTANHAEAEFWAKQLPRSENAPEIPFANGKPPQQQQPVQPRLSQQFQSGPYPPYGYPGMAPIGPPRMMRSPSPGPGPYMRGPPRMGPPGRTSPGPGRMSPGPGRMSPMSPMSPGGSIISPATRVRSPSPGPNNSRPQVRRPTPF